jgi:hypothetical protein
MKGLFVIAFVFACFAGMFVRALRRDLPAILKKVNA